MELTLRTLAVATLWYGLFGSVLGFGMAFYLRMIRAEPAPLGEQLRMVGLGFALVAFTSPLFLHSLVELIVVWFSGYTVLIALAVARFYHLQRGRVRDDIRGFVARPRFTRFRRND